MSRLSGKGAVITLTDHPEGLIMPVRAQPGARKAGVIGEQAGSLKVAVTAPAEDGKANKALLEELRDALGLKRSQLELVGGQTTREKRFLIRGLARRELEERLASLLGQ
jgi:uncharacterized protein (TIGR00251 family)